MTANLRHAAGSLLVVGLGGTELTALERAWLKLVRPGGVILFKRNIADAAQTRALLDTATATCPPHAVRCVDVEGGTVNRLRDALAPIPSVQAVGAAMRQANRPTLAREHGTLIARAVKAFGFNTTLAPVVDLGRPEAVEVLGSRTGGATTEEVIGYTRAFLEGLTAQGIAGCGKHFPGLGGASGDTHFVTPSIARTARSIWEEDLAPYRALHAAMPMVMMNHAAYPATPGGATPASASPYWIATVLRKRIGYRGIILSDDLEMGGILKFMPVEEAAIAAIRAGSDLLEICHSAELILRSYEALVSEGERSSTFRSLLLKRAREVEHKKKRLYAHGIPRALTATQLDALRAQIIAFSERVTRNAADTTAPRATAPAEAS
ncbi:MAG TPA: beta-N-acetylhexosaminidase [Terracidiphilus sp.]|jgi:beta-N-acetylhexosaminidase|nr:beta-N-acetylhexosaminidase [Terracidiphilus sp.]